MLYSANLQASSHTELIEIPTIEMLVVLLLQTVEMHEVLAANH